MKQSEIGNYMLSSQNVVFESFKYFYIDLKQYVGFSLFTLFTHSIILFMGSYLWVNHNVSYIHTRFDSGYLFSHNLWWLSLKVHFIVSMVCLAYAAICKFFLINNIYEVASLTPKLIFWFIPNILVAAWFLEDAYIFDYKTSVMLCLLPGILMSHPTMIVIRGAMFDLGDIHRFFLWCFYRLKAATV